MSASYQTRPFSRWRRVMADIYVVAKEKNFVHGLYEVDVTEARRCIHAYKTRTGDDFSFTAFLIGCIALAVDENKAVHALRWGKRLVVFDDVDVNVQVEHDVDGEKVVSTHVLRAANRKTMLQIHEEIRATQRQKISGASPVPSLSRWLLLAMYLPRFMRLLLLHRALNDPFLLHQLGGTVDITAIGMFGKGGGWGIPIAVTSLALVVGGIEQTVKCIDSQFCVREMLSLTLSVDHDVIDGAPAARFAARMKALIEAAYGLDHLNAPQANVTPESITG